MRIITGMHRSGTSLTARLAFESGAPMGAPEGFYRGDRWNPDGYYEQRDVLAVNRELVGGPWGRLSYLRLPSEGTVVRRARRLADRVRTAGRTYADALVKDARFALTLPGWTGQGVTVDAIVVCLREPSSVARSLRSRNHVPRRHALALWREHNRRLLAYCAGVPTWFVRYRTLLDPTTGDRELAGALDFLGRPHTPEGRRQLWDDCVKLHLDHHPPESSGPEPAPVAELWDDLVHRHRDQFTA